MPLFPVLETETLVQAKDKTRLDGSRSYAAGVNAITGTTIKPGADGASVAVDADGFLDWEFDGLTFDVVEDVNDRVDFEDEAGTAYSAQVEPGSYTGEELADAIADAMEAETALGFAAEFLNDKISISADAPFALKGESGLSTDANLLGMVGFAEDADLDESHEGDVLANFAKYVTLTVVNDASPTPDSASKSVFVSVISARLDKLFSSDAKLKSRESDIMKYLADGRASFKNFHRESQGLIFEWLDRQGFLDDFGDKLTKDNIKDVAEVQEWATMICLRLIFESVSNTTDDVFFRKARQYEKMEAFYRDKAVLRLDLNKDGEVDPSGSESLDVQHAIVVRR
jgi:hypothetical protein